MHHKNLNTSQPMMTATGERLEHGGGVLQLAKQYGIPVEQWLDLSTGINPNPYPFPELPTSVWSELPGEDDALLKAAQDYYQCDSILPVPGSQWAIEAIPTLLKQFIDLGTARVLVPRVGYLEHAWCWARQGCELLHYEVCPSEQQLADADICVVIQPNNPRGSLLSNEQLNDLHEQALAFGTLLVVDEAFVDAEDCASMVAQVEKGQLIVLRSLGKFFGLAGLRVGVVAAWPEFLRALRVQLSLWPISGPSRAVAILAWQDRAWQQDMRLHLKGQSQRLSDLLHQKLKMDTTGCALFQTLWPAAGQAESIHQTLCQAGIATRLIEDIYGSIVGLRIGLPASEKDLTNSQIANEAEWRRLERALDQIDLEVLVHDENTIGSERNGHIEPGKAEIIHA